VRRKGYSLSGRTGYQISAGAAFPVTNTCERGEKIAGSDPKQGVRLFKATCPSGAEGPLNRGGNQVRVEAHTLQIDRKSVNAGISKGG
jgi:hypothetical protein